MIVNVRGPAPSAKRFRVEIEASATLLDLSARIASQLGPLCPGSGFRLSMNKRDPLDGFLTSLSDLGVRHADLVYLLVGMGDTGCGGLFAAMSAALIAMRPPPTTEASTQTAPPPTASSGTQTLGRPFPSDTGTQTDIQGLTDGAAVDIERLGDGRGDRRENEALAVPPLAADVARPEPTSSANQSQGEQAQMGCEHEDAGATERAAEDAQQVATAEEAAGSQAEEQQPPGAHQEQDDDSEEELDPDASMPVVFPTPRDEEPLATASPSPIPTLQVIDTETQTLQHGQTCDEMSPFPEYSGPPCGQVPIDEDSDDEDSERYDCSALLPTQRAWGDDAEEVEEEEVEEQDYEDCDRKQRDGSDSDAEGFGNDTSCSGGGTAFLASTQTPESQPPPDAAAERKRRSMTPPVSLAERDSVGSSGEGGSGGGGNIRKRLRSSQQH